MSLTKFYPHAFTPSNVKYLTQIGDDLVAETNYLNGWRIPLLLLNITLAVALVFCHTAVLQYGWNHFVTSALLTPAITWGHAFGMMVVFKLILHGVYDREKLDKVDAKRAKEQEINKFWWDGWKRRIDLNAVNLLCVAGVFLILWAVNHFTVFPAAL